MSTSKRSGSALLTVLWLTAALSAIGLAVANGVRAETQRTETTIDDTRAYFVARGAVERAALHIQWRYFATPDGRPVYYAWGAPFIDMDFPDATARVEVIPETAKLNLNFTPPEVFFQLLRNLGVGDDKAADIARAIVDWRTSTDPMHPSPFDSFYLSQSPSFLPLHASFQESEELLLVKGITPELYYGAGLGNSRTGLRDCLSVYGALGSVDVNMAQPATMMALGMPQEAVSALVKNRAANPILDMKRFETVLSLLGPAGTHLRFGGLSMFTLRATVRLRRPDGQLSDLRRSVAALVKFRFPGNKENLLPGYEVLRWYDRS